MTDCQVAIIGAGPYGLSIAAHLLQIPGLEVRVFGEPMSFWQQRMPAGMLLRSPWGASHLSDPTEALTLDEYLTTCPQPFSAPIPLEHFIAYCHWFQSRAVPDIDRRHVIEVRREPAGYRLLLEGDAAVTTTNLIIATGIGSFASIPELFRGIPPELASHSSDHRDLSVFAGKDVVVIGAGQSALENAALLHEAGARVELLVRGEQVRFLGQRPWLHKWPLQQLLYARPDVGPALISHLVAHPDVYRQLPRTWQDRLAARSIRAAGAGWLKPRLEHITIACRRSVIDAAAKNERLQLKLDDGSKRLVDHAFLATGYRINIRRLDFLPPNLVSGIHCSNGYPHINQSFESSLTGLYFVGAPAALGFGPLMRFVAGTDFTARTLAREFAGRRQPARSLQPMAKSAVSTEPASPGQQDPATNKTSNGPASGKIPDCGQKESEAPGVLLTRADYRALGAVRSLGRRGIPVWVIKTSDHPMAAFSRYALRTFDWPSANESDQLVFLLELADRHDLKGWLLLPSDDEMVAVISRNHEQLSSRYRIAVPPWKQLQWACDKRLLYQLAERLQIRQPRTCTPGSIAEAQSLECTFPVLIKPAMHGTSAATLQASLTSAGTAINATSTAKSNRFLLDKAWKAENRSSLLSRYTEACTILPPEMIMIQELIPGDGDAQFSFAALCCEGRPLSSVIARRARQYPMDFGRFSTYVETVADAAIIEPACRLLASLGYTGLVEVEFKLDRRDGQFKLLDVNPRLWGWHTLGARAGVDFCWLFWQLLTGGPIVEMQGRAGIGWMRMATDLPVAIGEIAHGRLSLRKYLQSFRAPLESAVFAVDDPLPGLLEVPLMAYLYLLRLLR